MESEFGPSFDDPAALAKHIGEAVGTHYSSALRVTTAYGKFLAEERDSRELDALAEIGLGNFWLEVMRLENVRQSSPQVIRALRTDPSFYYSDFLETAEEVFEASYQGVGEDQRKKVGHTQHQQCIQLLRDHKAAGFATHFEVQNQVAKSLQMLRLMGGYRE